MNSAHASKTNRTRRLRRRAEVGAVCRDAQEGAQWWAREDLNLRPHAYQACALTS